MTQQPTYKPPSKFKIKIIQLLLWLKNLFTKKGRKDNYFNSAFKNIRKSVVKKLTSKRKAKQQLIEYVRFLQTGPKKSYWEIYQLCIRKDIKVDKEGNIYSFGLMSNLYDAGVKVDWKTMKFIN